MTVTRYIWLCLAIEAALLGMVGCAALQNPEQLAADARNTQAMYEQEQLIGDQIRAELDALRADLAALNPEDPDAAETADKLSRLIEEKTAESSEWLDRINAVHAASLAAQKKLAEGQNGWDTAEALATFAAGFFPPIGVAVPVIARARRNFEGVVAAVAAGGGPRDSEATRKAMAAVPGLKERVTAARVKINDKRMEAVPSRNNEAGA